MIKVYLGKSNYTDKEKVDKVRDELLERNVKVLEYIGGKYTDKDLLESDYLVIVPDNEDKEIGRGLYAQIGTFRKEKPNNLIVYYQQGKYYPVDVVGTTGKNDWKRFAKVSLLNNPAHLEEGDFSKELPNESPLFSF